jgi:hypothetical protein
MTTNNFENVSKLHSSSFRTYIGSVCRTTTHGCLRHFGRKRFVVLLVVVRQHLSIQYLRFGNFTQ